MCLFVTRHNLLQQSPHTYNRTAHSFESAPLLELQQKQELMWHQEIMHLCALLLSEEGDSACLSDAHKDIRDTLIWGAICSPGWSPLCSRQNTLLSRSWLSHQRTYIVGQLLLDDLPATRSACGVDHWLHKRTVHLPDSDSLPKCFSGLTKPTEPCSYAARHTWRQLVSMAHLRPSRIPRQTL